MNYRPRIYLISAINNKSDSAAKPNQENLELAPKMLPGNRPQRLRAKTLKMSSPSRQIPFFIFNLLHPFQSISFSPKRITNFFPHGSLQHRQEARSFRFRKSNPKSRGVPSPLRSTVQFFRYRRCKLSLTHISISK